MPLDARKPAALRPAAVAVHDDRNVARKLARREFRGIDEHPAVSRYHTKEALSMGGGSLRLSGVRGSTNLSEHEDRRGHRVLPDAGRPALRSGPAGPVAR